MNFEQYYQSKYGAVENSSLAMVMRAIAWDAWSSAKVEAAVLTDDEIDALARKYNLDGSMLHGSRFAMYLRPFARAIEARSKGQPAGGAS